MIEQAVRWEHPSLTRVPYRAYTDPESDRTFIGNPEDHGTIASREPDVDAFATGRVLDSIVQQLAERELQKLAVNDHWSSVGNRGHINPSVLQPGSHLTND